MIRRCLPMLHRLLLSFVLAACCTVAAAQEPQFRGTAVTEERLALVIGNSSYRLNALDNPVNDSRLIGGLLQKAGFQVSRHENLDRNALFKALRDFGDRLNEHTVAVFYYAGHALQLRDRNFLVPVDAEIRAEEEIPIFGVDLGFILNRMSLARSRINIVILDACRNNPFAGKTRPARGLAQMDAPVGTFLAFATAPGKVAEDGTGANTLYTEHLAKHLLTPGLPVETVFKRVRDAVVRGTDGAQVPWESSSLLGEFAFVPGVARVAQPDAAAEAAGEVAFWNSIQTSTRGDEYRAYLRQYPAGRFASLAQARLAAFAAAAPAGARADPMPRAGDFWRYRVQDQFRLGDLFVTATVAEVTTQGVVETWTTTSDAKLRSTLVSLQPGFHVLPGWDLTPPEFSPYLLASGVLRGGQKIGDQRRRIEQVEVPLKVSIEGEEDVAVQAGRFRATKLVLRGQARARGAGRAGPIATEHVVWYAPDVKRFIKYSISTQVGGSLQEATLFELIEYRVN
jgi:uncharacterized caspase-like protein